MDAALAVRALAAVWALPIGGWGARLLIGGVLGAALATLRPAPLPDAGALVGAVVDGLLLGFVAGLPIRALGGVHRRLGHYGRAAGWALFFAIGGPALWVAGLAADVGPLTEPGGGAFFTAVLLVGAPIWIVELALLPVLGWLDRVGVRGAHRLWPARGPLVVVGVALWLPALLGWLDPLWRAALGG